RRSLARRMAARRLSADHAVSAFIPGYPLGPGVGLPALIDNIRSSNCEGPTHNSTGQAEDPSGGLTHICGDVAAIDPVPLFRRYFTEAVRYRAEPVAELVHGIS